MKDLIKEYLQKNDWRIKENANMEFSLQGLNNYLAGTITKQYWIDQIYDKPIRNKIETNHINIHDMDQLSAYCVGHDIRTLLLEGFKGVEGKVESGPAKHFSSILSQCFNFIFTMQGETAGAQAFSNFDTYLSPFIKYDGLDYKTVKQELQRFVFNLNIPTRVGFQSPFSNVTLDLQCPKFMENEAVIIGGEPQEQTYGEFQDEMNMFNQAFLEVMNEGDNRGRVFTFPVPTYNIDDNFKWDTNITDLIINSALKYGIPTFSNFIGSELSPDDVRSMCCRLRIDNKKLTRGGGQFGSAPLTGSVGVVTLNLPRIAYDSDRDMHLFFKKLKDAAYQAHRSLEKKREFIETLTESGLYPYTAYYMKDIKARTGKYWSNHFSTIGIIGMEEALTMLGYSLVDNPEVGIKVMDFLQSLIEKSIEVTGNLYNLEATPAEGTCYKLALKDKAECSDIYTQGSGNSVYYTNSTHIPHLQKLSLVEELVHQNKFQPKYSGGTTLPIYIGEGVTDIESSKELIKSICEHTEIPYFSLIPTFSICGDHGYLPGKIEQCFCGKETEIYTKVVGFIRPIKNYNKGKRKEFEERAYRNLQNCKVTK